MRDGAARRPLSAPLSLGFDQVETWLFDLDNTLYPASCSLFPQIDVRMKAFIASFLGVPPDEAARLQKFYYHHYGTTLRGLMDHHGMKPDGFLEYVHDIDHDVLTPDPLLAEAIAKLPGRKVIYTNGSQRHAEKVLDRLTLTSLFDDIFDIKAAEYHPKPQGRSYDLLQQRCAIDPKRTVFFEDSQKNLKPAFDLGMITVWVRSGPEHFPEKTTPECDVSHCLYETDDLAAWLRQVPVGPI